MKTAISVPDELFERAEAAARKMEVSRSELYALALRNFLEDQDQGALAKKITQFYGATRVRVDPVLHSAQLKVLKRSEW